MIVVMAIMAAVIAVVGTRFSQTRDGLQHMARQAAALARIARTEALVQRTEQRLVIDPRRRRITLAGRADLRRLNLAPLDVGREVTVSVSPDVPHGPRGERYFAFYPDGSASPGTLQLRRGGERYTVAVGLFAHVR
ncbi:MAG: hypothetical protein KGJ12_01890 [Gammaproteobacteria bacterium]|nr:hypothetical protein [Gammaproteobacteria bacterium]